MNGCATAWVCVGQLRMDLNNIEHTQKIEQFFWYELLCVYVFVCSVYSLSTESFWNGIMELYMKL